MALLKGLPRLKELHVEGAWVVVGQSGTAIRSSYSSARVTDAGLAHLKGLTELERLNFLGTKITDTGAVHLEKLTTLKTLYLEGTRITDSGLQKLQQSLPNTTIDN